MLPALATQILMAMSEQNIPAVIEIDVKDGEITYKLDPKAKTVKKRASKKPKTLEA